VWKLAAVAELNEQQPVCEQRAVHYGVHVPRSRAGARAFGTLLLVVVSASACYRYVPVQPTAVRASEEVRVRITESAAARLVSELGTYTGQLEGQLAPEGTDSLSVSVLIGRQYRGMALENARQTLFLGRGEIVGVSRRQLSRGRTVLATATVLAAFGVLVSNVVQLGDPNPSVDDPPPPPPGVHRMYIRVPIP
jgi:hypothetical protein